MINTSDNQSYKDNSWQKIILPYTRPDIKKSIWQICNSLIPYILLWFLMVKSLEYPYWVTLILAIAASGFLIRLFIIFHDCGHGAFFKSGKANRLVGIALGLLAFTPYYKWHNQHRIHHATNSNLDMRGTGDVWTMTVAEYINASKKRRFFYRTFRNPFILFSFGPIYIVFIQNRLTRKNMSVQEKRNVYITNIMILMMATMISFVIGVKAYLMIQIPVILISHMAGLWLFYIQHQFDEVEWERGGNWDYKAAALKGSSFLKLPKVLQWFTGNIGFHHVHHLSSRIPNYYLEKCHNENGLFSEVKPVILISTFKALRLNLWDEANHRLVKFSRLSQTDL